MTQPNITVTCTCGKQVEILPTPRPRFYWLAQHTITFVSIEMIKRGDKLTHDVFRGTCPMSGLEIEET